MIAFGYVTLHKITGTRPRRLETQLLYKTPHRLDYDDPACALVQIADPGAGK
jgi:hypothetical protein